MNLKIYNTRNYINRTFFSVNENDLQCNFKKTLFCVKWFMAFNYKCIRKKKCLTICIL